jgi:hypothetical protein
MFQDAARRSLSKSVLKISLSALQYPRIVLISNRSKMTKIASIIVVADGGNRILVISGENKWIKRQYSLFDFS